MSRLADLLTLMDREAAEPPGPAQIPHLTFPKPFTPLWHRVVLLVAVVALLSAGAAVTVRPKSAAMTTVLAATPIVPPLTTSHSQPVPADDERFSGLRTGALQAAERGELAQSAALLRKALELKPADAEAWNSLGVVLVWQGESGRGVDAFSDALSVDPNHVEAHRNLAVALDRQGRWGQAAAHYRHFLRLATDDHPARGDARRRLIEVSLSQGKQ
jgi:cytochrome c-type biogenesis protein CcmH/NrfG